jgi:alkylation response protein AidB-like acyl-CoA dehydrogenase
MSKRDPMGLGLAVLNRLAATGVLDRLGVRKYVESGVGRAARSGFRAAAAAGRSFSSVRNLGKPARLPSADERGLFDLTPSEEQQMITETVREFAAEQLRPAAEQADADCAPPSGLAGRAGELGITLVGVPDELGGIGSERSAVTGALVAEALAHGDMGLAVSVLAAPSVATALVLWGDEDQQSRYLPAFTGDNPPAAALAVTEPRALFDPFSLATKAHRTPDGFVLSGVKSLVPLAAQGELFLVAADLEGRGPALFCVESSNAGLSVESDPSMGLRSAACGRLHLDGVRLPAGAMLCSGDAYAQCVRLSRLGWAALATGTSQAVLDYVVPYVNERQAFGEPVSHRQGVAFKVSEMATELEGLRLVTHRAASRAEQGLPFAREAALARGLAAEKGMAIGNDGVQLLGGHGFVKDHPVERWYRDLRAVGVAEGVVLV